MFCAKCGAPLNGAAFCGSCGTAANGAPAAPVAPQQVYVNPNAVPTYAPTAPTSGLAIAGFIVSFFGWFGIVGFILSLVALNQIKNSNGTKGGRGLAIAGAIIGGLWTFFLVIGVIALASYSSTSMY
ncbi:MAG: hypothetical protein RIS26_1037 [Actinomycetota bacterium]|jgi:hypothetical protein